MQNTMMNFLQALNSFYSSIADVSLINGISFGTFFMYPFILCIVLGLMIHRR